MTKVKKEGSGVNEDLASIESLKAFWGDDFEPLCPISAVKERLDLKREEIRFSLPRSNLFQKEAV